MMMVLAFPFWLLVTEMVKMQVWAGSVSAESPSINRKENWVHPADCVSGRVTLTSPTRSPTEALTLTVVPAVRGFR